MTEPSPRILIADDQPDVLHALRLLLRAEGFEAKTASSPRDVAAAVAEQEFDVVLIDLNYTRDTTSGKEGLDLLTRLQAVDPNLPVIVMTAWGTIDGAVEAMRRGARDYVEKPWDNAACSRRCARRSSSAARSAADRAPRGREPPRSRPRAAPS